MERGSSGKRSINTRLHAKLSLNARGFRTWPNYFESSLYMLHQRAFSSSEPSEFAIVYPLRRCNGRISRAQSKWRHCMVASMCLFWKRNTHGFPILPRAKCRCIALSEPRVGKNYCPSIFRKAFFSSSESACACAIKSARLSCSVITWPV